MVSNVEVVTELGRRFAAGDGAGAAALFHPQIRIEQPASLPHGGWHLGHEGMASMGAVFGQYWSRVITDPRIFGCDGRVVQVTTQTWTAKSTGRSAAVDVVEAYRTVTPADLKQRAGEILTRHPDWIAFTSSSTVQNFIDAAGADTLQHMRTASIG